MPADTPNPRPGPVRRLLPWAALFCGAVVLRWGVMMQTRDGPFFEAALVDAQWHAEWAERICAGAPAPQRPYFRAPLYPLFLAGVRALGGSFAGVKAVQHLIGALTCLGVVALGTRVYGRAAGWAAGVGLALYGPLIYFENELLIPTLAVAGMVAVLWLLLRAAHGGWVWLPSAGLVLGGCAVCRPNFLALIPWVVVWWAWMAPAGRRWRGCATLALAAALPIVPVTVINWQRSGEFVLIATQGGINFFIGNNPAADGRTAEAVADAYLPGMSGYRDNVWASSAAVAEAETGAPLSDAAVSRYWYGRGLRWWLDEPVRAAGLLVRKAYYFVHGFEIESNRSMYVERLWSWLFAALVWDVGIACPGGLLWPLAVVGACLSATDGRAAWLLRGTAVLYAATVIAFFVTARFKMPVVPIAMVFAGHAAVWSVRTLRSSWRAFAPAGVGLLVVGLISNASWADVRRIDHTRQASLIATAYLQRQRYHGAIPYLQRALELDPGRYSDTYNLALAYQRIGQTGPALDTMARAVALRPQRADVHNEYATLLSAAGLTAAAAEHYRWATELDPALAMAHGNLGITRVEQGDLDGARASLHTALTLAPGRPRYLLWLAIAEVEAGAADTARASFVRAESAGDGALVATYCGLAGHLDAMGRRAAAVELRRRSAASGRTCE